MRFFIDTTMTRALILAPLAVCTALLLAFVFLVPGMQISRTRCEPAKTSSETAVSVPKAVPTFRRRDDLGNILESEGMQVGAELGVQAGHFAKAILSRWTSCRKYVLVDLWRQQQHYKDLANVDNERQEKLYRETLKNLERWSTKTEVCRNYTSICAAQYPDEYFDYVFLDARHDFKGVEQDLTNWWPKVKPNGIMAGHDYLTHADVAPTGQDWTLNYDGTRDTTGTIVQGAVDKFFMSGNSTTNPHYRQVIVSYRADDTWAVRK